MAKAPSQAPATAHRVVLGTRTVPWFVHITPSRVSRPVLTTCRAEAILPAVQALAARRHQRLRSGAAPPRPPCQEGAGKRDRTAPQPSASQPALWRFRKA